MLFTYSLELAYSNDWVLLVPPNLAPSVVIDLDENNGLWNCPWKKNYQNERTRTRSWLHPCLGKPYILVHLLVTLDLVSSPPLLQYSGELFVKKEVMMKMQVVSPLLQNVVFMFLNWCASCVKLINVKEKHLRVKTQCLFDFVCFFSYSMNNVDLSSLWFSCSTFASAKTSLELSWGRVLMFLKLEKIHNIVTIILDFTCLS